MTPAQIPLQFDWIRSSGPLGGAVLVLGGTAR
jgi:hypothetical protein